MIFDVPPSFPKVLASAQRLPAETANHGPLLRMSRYQLVLLNGRLHKRAHAVHRNSAGPLKGSLSSLQGVIQVLCVSSQPEKRAQTELQIEAGTLRSMCTSAGIRVLRCLRAWMPAA